MRMRPKLFRTMMTFVPLFVTAIFIGCAGPAGSKHRGASEKPLAESGTQPSGKSKVTELLRQALPDTQGNEVRVLTVDYPAGVRSAPHRHPGAVFAYVLEGEVLCQVEGQPLRTYRQGEVWYEYPQQLHQVSGNASNTESAKLLVFFLAEKDKPVLVPEK